MTYDDALGYLTNLLRDPRSTGASNYGYDIWLPNVMFKYLHEYEGATDAGSATPRMTAISPQFLSAAWDLCRRGVLRPSVREYQAQAVEGGFGFCVTAFGRKWLAESDSVFVPTEPSRFASMLRPLASHLGAPFYARGQEAVSCFNAQCYMACCAMCGAAAESILIALACEVRTEAEVLRVYAGAQGRSRVEKLVTAPPNQWAARELLGFTALLKYWRDESAHGLDNAIGSDEAFIALAMLLRFAIWADEKRDALAPSKPNEDA